MVAVAADLLWRAANRAERKCFVRTPYARLGGISKLVRSRLA